MTDVSRIILTIDDSEVTVENFSASLGWNSSPSTLNVTVVEDPDPDSDPDTVNPQTFAADSYDDSDIDGQIKAGLGGAPFIDGNPGSLISIDAGTFNFTGLITSWRRTNSQSGRKINIQAQDPRILLSKIPVVLNGDLYTNSTANDSDRNVGHPNSTFNPNVHNIVEILGDDGNDKRYGHPLNSANGVDGADFTREGVQFRKLPFFFAARTFSMMGKTFLIDFTSAPTSRHLLYKIPINYRVPVSNSTMSSLLDKAAQDNNFDWYVDVATDDGSDDDWPANVDFKLLIKAVPRTANPDIFNDSVEDNPITKFLTTQKEKLISFDVGRELRTDAQDVMITGDNRRTIWNAAENHNGTQLISPVFGAFRDGRVLDRMIIPLDTVQGSNSDLVSTLPDISSEKGSVTTTPGEANLEDQYGNFYTPYSDFEKLRGASDKKGYAATAEILRAALYNRESWVTAVWYYYLDAGLADIPYKLYDGYDDGVGGIAPIARVASADVSTISTGVPESMGIYGPAFDRGNPESPFKARMGVWSSTGLTDTFKEQKLALQEACFKATVKAAEEYYGKKFLVTLPYSITWDGYLAGENTKYNANDRDVLPDYDLTDGGLPYTDPSHGNGNELTDLTGTPEIYERDNDAFITKKGLYKPMMVFSHNSVWGGNAWSAPHYCSVDYSEFSSEKSAKIPFSSGGNEHINFDFLTSDVTFKRYQYDPRFALATLGAPIKLGYGHIRGIQVTYVTQGTDKGDVSSASATIEPATQVTKKDTSGAFQSFASYIYKDFTIVHNLTTEVNGITIPTKVIDNGVSKFIDAKYYDALMYAHAKEKSETFGLDQIRYIGTSQTNTDEGGVPHHVDMVGATLADYQNDFALNAMAFFVPLKWNYFHYGPFSNVSSLSSPALIVSNKNLNPWNYGSTGAMDRAGKILASNAASEVHTLSYMHIDVEGYPEFNFGYNPDDASDSLNEVYATLSDLRISQGMGGIKTSYTFRTYFGQTSKRKREELDQLRFSETAKNELKKDIIKLDDIMRDLDIETGNKFENPYNAGSGHGSGSGGGGNGVNVIKAVPPARNGEPSTSAGSQGEVSEQNEARTDLAGTAQEEHHAGLSELWIPAATHYPESTEGFVPSINGIPLDSHLAASGDDGEGDSGDDPPGGEF